MNSEECNNVMIPFEMYFFFSGKQMSNIFLWSEDILSFHDENVRVDLSRGLVSIAITIIYRFNSQL